MVCQVKCPTLFYGVDAFFCSCHHFKSCDCLSDEVSLLSLKAQRLRVDRFTVTCSVSLYLLFTYLTTAVLLISLTPVPLSNSVQVSGEKFPKSN